MDNKVILITGASDGIGKETAKALAKQGHTIIMHGRNPQKTKSAYEEVKTKSDNNNIEYLVADFLSLAEIKRFADNIKQKYDRLDVLVNNAGAQFTGKRKTTENNVHQCFRSAPTDYPSVAPSKEKSVSKGSNRCLGST